MGASSSVGHGGLADAARADADAARTRLCDEAILILNAMDATGPVTGRRSPTGRGGAGRNAGAAHRAHAAAAAGSPKAQSSLYCDFGLCKAKDAEARRRRAAADAGRPGARYDVPGQNTAVPETSRAAAAAAPVARRLRTKFHYETDVCLGSPRPEASFLASPRPIAGHATAAELVAQHRGSPSFDRDARNAFERSARNNAAAQPPAEAPMIVLTY
ncbi:hypothetical protein M885DRAFT_534463 [Pelagophyceae sp. CCMP2097]|nr:hypothetical protein M885DRAFT_534463 [Pelagophyceae sp. CCMP2097]